MEIEVPDDEPIVLAPPTHATECCLVAKVVGKDEEEQEYMEF